MVVSGVEGLVADLVAKACSGDRRAVARLLTLVEGGGEAADRVAEATHPLAAGAHVVGVTGAPGSGKSTLTAGLTATLAESGRRPAVLAVDPSSPLTGGAILGDRVRMEAAAQARACVEQLDDRSQQLVKLRFEDGLSYKQMSERTGLTVTNVGYILHKSLKKLATSLKQSGYIHE